MQNSIIGSLLVFAAWLVMFAGLLGNGILARKLFRFCPQTGSQALFDTFWLGWAVVIGGLQLWHFFAPLNGFALLVTLTTGFAGLAIYHRELLTSIRHVSPSKVAWLAVIVLGLWLANRTLWFTEPMSPFMQWDTGTYHLQSVKWNTQFPLTPGAANINMYFGVNSNYFRYAALFDNWIWSSRSSYLATGLMMVALLAQALLSLPHLISGDRLQSKIALYLGLSLAPLLLQADHIHSLETDLPVYLLSILLTGQLYLYFLERQARTQYEFERLFLILVVVVVGLTIKLNFGIYGLLALLTATTTSLILARHHVRQWCRQMLPRLAIFSLAVIIPWLIGTVILSGYMVHPIAATAVNVPWRVPVEVIQNEYGHIQTVARVVKAGTDESIIKGWTWLRDWIDQIPVDIVRLVNLLFLSLLVFAVPIRKGEKPRIELLSLLPLLVYLPYWFFQAPAIRFVQGQLWSGALLVFCLAINRLEQNTNQPILLLRLALIAGLILYIAPFKSPLWILPRDASELGFKEYYLPTLQERTTLSGLKVSVPVGSKDELRCWNAPPLCMPIYTDKLEAFSYNFLGQERVGYRLSP